MKLFFKYFLIAALVVNISFVQVIRSEAAEVTETAVVGNPIELGMLIFQVKAFGNNEQSEEEAPGAVDGRLIEQLVKILIYYPWMGKRAIDICLGMGG